MQTCIFLLLLLLLLSLFYDFFSQKTCKVLTTLYRFIVQTDALGGAGKSKVCKNCLDNEVVRIAGFIKKTFIMSPSGGYH